MTFRVHGGGVKKGSEEVGVLGKNKGFCVKKMMVAADFTSDLSTGESSL